MCVRLEDPGSRIGSVGVSIMDALSLFWAAGFGLDSQTGEQNYLFSDYGPL